MIDSRILIGLIAMLITIAAIVYIGINEPDRQAEFTEAFAGRSIESGALIFEETCSPCHGDKGQGVPGRGPQLNSHEFFENRLGELGYIGTMDAYLTLTISGGRPAMSTSGPWAENMPTWSVDFGGPLRNDQIRNVVDFIQNWEEGAPPAGAPLTAAPVGDTPEARGGSLFQSKGCVGCHMVNGVGQTIGPDLTNVYGEKGEEYVRESILMPNAVIAEGFEPIMPETIADTLSDEELNDIVAYLESVSN